jgi:heat shock 70kDa protein 1/2/6/8
MTKLIPKNCSIPCKKSQIFTTYQNNQQTISLKVFEGERAMTKDNKLYAKFEISGIFPSPRGVPQIEIVFNIDANANLKVSVVDKTNNLSLVIKEESDNFKLFEIEQMIKKENELKIQDEQKLIIYFFNNLKLTIKSGKKNFFDLKIFFKK